MDETGTTTATLDQADDEILTYAVSDEALEAAAVSAGRAFTAMVTDCSTIIAACCR